MPPKTHHIDPRVALQESDEEEEYEEVDVTEIMNEMTTVERRRVYALKGLFEGYKAVRAKFREEMAELEREHAKATAALFETRRAIITGEREVTAEEIARIPAGALPAASAGAESTEKPKGVQVVSPGDAQANAALQAAGNNPNGGIPDFWLTALTNTEVFDGMITERDRDAVRHLIDIRSAYINGNPNEGVILSFFFSPNEYFSNDVLTKTYNMEFNEEDGDVEIAKVEGCDIAWKSDEKNLTVITKQKKQRNKNTKQVRVVTRQEKCESFFNFFSPPKEPGQGSGSDDDEEDEDFYNQEMEMDVEAGQALMEEIVPKAAHYYCGKSVEETARELQRRFGFGAEDDEEEESEEDEEDGDDTAGSQQMVNRRGGGPAAGRGRGAAPQQQECKQQ